MRTAVLLVISVLLPAFAVASALVNINTANAALLDTLPGIGPAYATRIVDYRTAHGLFARIEDIQNVSGIGPSTFADIKSFITVGDISTPSASPSVASSTSAASPSTVTVYAPPPSALALHLSADPTAFLEVPFRLSARVTAKSGAEDPSAQIVWSFGDGSSATGSEAEKVYHYEGTYLIVANSSDGSAKAHDELVITVKPASVRVLIESGEGITIANEGKERLDLSGWRLLADMRSFRIPDGTSILPESKVLFPSTITNLVAVSDAALAYPSGIIAARVATPAVTTSVARIDEQLIAPVVSYTQVSEVEPMPSASTNIQSYDEAVSAPTATTEVAAVGAAVSSSLSAPSPRASGMFTSPWTLGLLGVIVAAGGAFIFL